MCRHNGKCADLMMTNYRLRMYKKRHLNITMTSQWARLLLKSPAWRLFAQPFIQGADQGNQSCASLAFVRGIHRWPVNSPHKGTVNSENVSIWWRNHEMSVLSGESQLVLELFEHDDRCFTDPGITLATEELTGYSTVDRVMTSE